VVEGVPIVAFNASFDLDLLDAELGRHGLPTVRDRLGREAAPLLDPLVLDRYVAPGRAGPRRLVDLCDHYGVASAGRLHTADVDVVATLDLLDALVRTFPELGGVDAATVHEYQVTARREWADRAAARRAERAAARRAERRLSARLRAWVSRRLQASRLRSVASRLARLGRGRSRAERRAYRPPP
jgi:DNA polymerase-3 subunit epsilon